MTDHGSPPPPAHKRPAKKKRWSMPGIGVLAVILLVLIGRLFLEGILSNPLANPCSFQSRRYEDFGSNFYAPLMRLKFRSSYPQDKVFVMPLTAGDDPGNIPASAVENPCEGRRFMAGLVDRLDAYGPSVIVIDRYYNDDDRCPETSGANDALRVSLSSSPSFAHLQPPSVVVGRDSGKAGEEQTGKTGGNCLIDKTPLKLDADQIPAGRMRRHVYLGLARLNSDVLRIPLRWWLSPSPDAQSHQDRPAAGLALAAYSLAALGPTPDNASKIDQGLPVRGEPSGLVTLLNNDAHPYAFFPKKTPPQISPIDLLCADKDGQDFFRRYLLGIHSPQDAIPANAAHPEQRFCKSAKPLPVLGGKVIVIGVRDDDVDMHDFPGGEQHGVDLQADYIEALLDNAYIKTAPQWLDWGLTILLCVLLLGREVMPDYATASWWVALLWDLGAILIVMALSIMALFAGYFTPTFWLACSGVVLTEVITRLFERITHHVRHRAHAHAKHH